MLGKKKIKIGLKSVLILLIVLVNCNNNIIFAQNFKNGTPPVVSGYGKYYNSDSKFKEELESREFVYYSLDYIIKYAEMDKYMNNSSSSIIKWIDWKIKNLGLEGIGKTSYEGYLKLEDNTESYPLFKSYKKNNLIKYKLYNQLTTKIEEEDLIGLISILSELKYNIFKEILYYQTLIDNNKILTQDISSSAPKDSTEKKSIHKLSIRKYISTPSDADFILNENMSQYKIIKKEKAKNLFYENEYIFENNILRKINYYKPKLIAKEKTAEGSYDKLTPVGIAFGEVQYGIKNTSYNLYTYKYGFYNYGSVRFNKNGFLESIDKKKPFDYFELKFNNGVPAAYNSSNRNFILEEGLLFGQQAKDIDNFNYSGQGIIYINNYTIIEQPFCDSDFKITNYSFEEIKSDTKESNTQNANKFFTEIVGGCNEGFLKIHYCLTNKKLENEIKLYMQREYMKFDNKRMSKVFSHLEMFKGVDLHSGKLNDFGCYIKYIDALEALSYGMTFENFFKSIKEHFTVLDFSKGSTKEASQFPAILKPLESNIWSSNNFSEWAKHGISAPKLKIGVPRYNTFQEGLLFYGGEDYTSGDGYGGEWVNEEAFYGFLFGLSYTSSADDTLGIFFMPQKSNSVSSNTESRFASIYQINSKLNEAEVYIIRPEVVTENQYGEQISYFNHSNMQVHNVDDNVKEDIINGFKQIINLDKKNKISKKSKLDLSKFKIETSQANKLEKTLHIIESLEIKKIPFPFSGSLKVTNINSKKNDVEKWPDWDPTGWDYNIYEYNLFESSEYSLKQFLDTTFLNTVNNILASQIEFSIKKITKEKTYLTPIQIPVDEKSSFTKFIPILYQTEFIKIHYKDNSSIIFIDAENYIDSYLSWFITSYKIEPSKIEDLKRKIDRAKQGEWLFDEEYSVEAIYRNQKIYYWYKELENAKEQYKDKFIFGRKID
jgi:hypothetical protein